MHDPFNHPSWKEMRAFLVDHIEHLDSQMQDYRALEPQTSEEVRVEFFLARRIERTSRALVAYEDGDLLKLIAYFAAECRELREDGDAVVHFIATTPSPSPLFHRFIIEEDAERLANALSFLLFLYRHAWAPHG